MKKQLTTALLALFPFLGLKAQISFNTFTNYPINSHCDHLAKGDFNNDGKTDIAVSSIKGTGPGDNKVYVFHQNISGTFDSPVTYDYVSSSPVGILGMTGGDVNGDGLDDAVIGVKDSIGVLYQNTLGGFDSIQYYPLVTSTTTLHIGDFNGDGNNDVNGSAMSFNNFAIYFGDSLGNLVPPAKASFWPGATVGYPVGFGKILNDTAKIFRIDKSGNNIRLIVLSVALNKFFTFTPFTLATSSFDIMDSGLGDMDGNGTPELVVLTDSLSSVSMVHIWDTLPQTFPSSSIILPHSAQVLECGDLNGDGIDEIVVIHSGIDSVSVISQQYGVQAFYLPCPGIEKRDGVVIADVNNDGKPDIVSVNDSAGLSVLYNTTITGIPNVGIQDNFIISPNPTNGKVTVQVIKLIEKDYVFSLRSLVGKEIFRQKITSEKESFFIPTDSPGIYIGTVSDDNQIIQRTKIVFLK